MATISPIGHLPSPGAPETSFWKRQVFSLPASNMSDAIPSPVLSADASASAPPQCETDVLSGTPQAQNDAGVPWTRCMEFLPRKKRHCTGIRKPGYDFCGAHLKLGRVPCPVDPTHTVFAQDVDKHVPRCTRTAEHARMALIPCYQPGINAGNCSLGDNEALSAWRLTWDGPRPTGSAADPSPDAVLHPAPDTLALTRMLARLDLHAFASRVEAWCSLWCADQAGRGELWGAPESGSGAPPPPPPSQQQQKRVPAATAAAAEGGGLPDRHERQAQAIAQAMRRAGIFARVGGSAAPALLVEFGAGKGLLGATVQAALAAEGRGGSPQLLLIERGANRLKADRRMMSPPPQAQGSAGPAPPPAHSQRLRMDIADLALERHPAAWGVPLADLVRLPEWVNAAGHDKAAEERRMAGYRAAEERRAAAAGAVAVAAEPAEGGVSDPKEAVGEGPVAAGSGARPPNAKRRRESAEPAAHAAATPPHDNASVTRPAAPCPAPGPPFLCALGKHLCGGATDLALRCVARTVWGAAATLRAEGEGEAAAGEGSGEAPAAPHPPPRLVGVAIATCCHHSCSWGAYVGKRFFRACLGGGPVEFEALRRLSAWGCMPLVEEGRGGPAAPAAAAAPPAEGPALGPPMDRAARVALGRRCKSLLDAGRVWFLRSLLAEGPGVTGPGGPPATARMLPYCSGADSPENMLLLLGGPAV